MSYSNRREGNPVAGLLAALVGLAFIAFAVVPAFVAMFSWTKTDGGHVAIVRNGGPFDNNSIRQYLPASSSLTYTGLYSSVHEYPAQGRYYDIVPTGSDAPGVNAYRTPTKDGVDVGLVGRFNFQFNTDETVLRKFDDHYGTRTFPKVDATGHVSAWEGEDGFATWLDVVAKPVIEETLRQEVGSVDCAQLQASCALVQNAKPGDVALPDVSNTATLKMIQEKVRAALAVNLADRLGGEFLTGIQFSLTGVDLPREIRDRIIAAQAEFAGASAAQARLNTARLDADTNEQRQRGYNLCPTCADIDRIRAQGEALSKIPGSVEVYAPGGDGLVPLR